MRLSREGVNVEFLNLFLFIYVYAPVAFFVILAILGVFIAPLLLNVPYQMVGDTAVIGRSGFFTKMTPGWVKVLERGDSFVRCIMDYPGHKFLGDTEAENLNVRSSEFWEVVKTPAGETDADPITFPKFNFWSFFPFYRYGFWLWKKIIYSTNGCVFTGIPGFQGVRVYPLEYFVEITTGDGKFTLTRKKNYSDHYRVIDFDAFVPMESADTKDIIPLSITVGLVARIFNPWLTAYNSDGGNWGTRLNSIIPSRVNDYTRTMPLEDVLSGDTTGLTDMLLALGDKTNSAAPLPAFGFILKQATTPNRSLADPSILNESEKKLGDVAFARVDARAREIRAEGDANAIRKQAQAIKDGGDDARMAAQIDGQVRIVKAAGDRAIINIGGGSDPFLKGLYAEATKEKK